MKTYHSQGESPHGKEIKGNSNFPFPFNTLSLVKLGGLLLALPIMTLLAAPNALAGGYYCPCNQTVYPSLSECTAGCRVNLGCFVDICSPSEIPESCPLIKQKLLDAEQLWSFYYQRSPTEGQTSEEYSRQIEQELTGEGFYISMAFDYTSDTMLGIWAAVGKDRIPQGSSSDWLPVEGNPQGVWLRIIEFDGTKTQYYDTVLDLYKQDYGNSVGEALFDAQLEHEMSHMNRYRDNPDLYSSNAEAARQDELDAYEAAVQKLRELLRKLNCQTE